MVIFIREAAEPDLPALRRMDLDVVLFVQGLDPTKDLETVKIRHADVFDKWLNLDHQKVFIAFDDHDKSNPVGFIWLVNNVEQFTGVPYCFVMDIGVKDGCRKKGIGKALMERAMQYTQERNFKFLKLMVDAKNKDAMRFYRDCGFEVEDLYMRKNL